jgi:hypothetical protein
VRKSTQPKSSVLWATTPPEFPVQITRLPSLTEPQFQGCLSAFLDSLSGELNSAAMYLRKLEGQPKGAAFAYEMSLDRHRYGALTVLDRWSALVTAFGPRLQLSRYPAIAQEAAARVAVAEEILLRANQVIDACAGYESEAVEACILAFQSLSQTFAEEHQAAVQTASLGPMLSAEYREARATFLRDLSVR